MIAPAIALGIASLFFSAVSVVQQFQAAGRAEDAAEEQKKQNEAQRRLAEIRNRRQKIEEIRQQRIAAATIRSSAEATGTSKSSGVQGGIFATQSQAASNIGFLNQVEQTSQAIYSSRSRESDIRSDIAQKQAFASISGTLGQTFRPALLPMFKEFNNNG
jgi:hypothetical protein